MSQSNYEKYAVVKQQELLHKERNLQQAISCLRDRRKFASLQSIDSAIHNNMPFGSDLNGNVLENDKWDGVIHDYQTATPELILTCNGYLGGNGVGTIHIPIKYCPECGRKLGKEK